MPRKTLTPPEKRRTHPPSGSASPSRPARPSSNMNPPPAAATTGPRGGAILAPPPRAALSGASSPVPDDRRNSSTASASAAGSSSDAASTVAAAAAAAATQVLRTKDARIADLERELAVMEDVFTRELDKLSRAESDSSSSWQAKCGALAARLQDAETERDELRASWEAARRDVLGREDEVRQLRGQVRGLKEWVSTSTRSDGAATVTDDRIGLSMTKLGNELQNWVLVNLRRARIDVSKADGATLAELGRLVPMYEEVVSTSRLHLLQSLVSRLLVELVFNAYFVGLPDDQARQITQVETFLSSFASSPEPINQWRSHTLTILRKEANQRLQKETSYVVETIVQRVNSILDAITDTSATDARDQGLRALVTSAVDLSRLLVVQKAIFKVFMPELLPHQRTVFDPATMEDLGGEDDDGLEEREICCVAFPGIIKRGDESGGQLQYRNVVAKATVVCSPE